MREALMGLSHICHGQTLWQTAEPFLAPVSGLLEPLGLGQGAPADHSRANVCQWTTSFEALSPLETYLSNRERETSTNYTFQEFQFRHLSLDLSVVDGPSEARFHRRFVLLHSRSKWLKFCQVAGGNAL